MTPQDKIKEQTRIQIERMEAKRAARGVAKKSVVHYELTQDQLVKKALDKIAYRREIESIKSDGLWESMA